MRGILTVRRVRARPRLRRWMIGLISCLVLQTGLAQDTVPFTDERTGVKGWRFERDGIRVQLIQRLPDQTKAFFLGRGFQPAAADRLASRCLFQTIVHNIEPLDGDHVVVDLGEWRVVQGEERESLLLKGKWQQEWARLGVTDRARTAFQWAFFPTRQDFAPGDWNMGMTSYPVEPGAPLTLELVWQKNDRRHQGRIDGVVCGSNDMAAELSK